MNSITFTPWIGPDFGQEKDQFNKLLIIGESHYITDEDPEYLNSEQFKKDSEDFTSVIVEAIISKRFNNPFFRNITNSLSKSGDYEIWNSLAFANAIQNAMDSSKKQPSTDDIATVKDGLWEILDIVKPNKVIFCSYRMWEKWLPDEDSRCHSIGSINEGEQHSTVWEYSYNGGKCNAIGIKHPSKYFSPQEWKPFIQKFLNL